MYADQEWSRIASLAPAVLTCEFNSDPVASEIARQACEDLVCAAAAAAGRCNFANRYPLILSGLLLPTRFSWPFAAFLSLVHKCMLASALCRGTIAMFKMVLVLSELSAETPMKSCKTPQQAHVHRSSFQIPPPPPPGGPNPSPLPPGTKCIVKRQPLSSAKFQMSSCAFFIANKNRM